MFIWKGRNIKWQYYHYYYYFLLPKQHPSLERKKHPPSKGTPHFGHQPQYVLCKHLENSQNSPLTVKGEGLLGDRLPPSCKTPHLLTVFRVGGDTPYIMWVFLDKNQTPWPWPQREDGDWGNILDWCHHGDSLQLYHITQSVPFSILSFIGRETEGVTRRLTPHCISIFPINGIPFHSGDFVKNLKVGYISQLAFLFFFLGGGGIWVCGLLQAP